MKILLAVDGSRYARAAARFLARFLPGPGKHVDVMAVAPPAPSSPHPHYGPARELRAHWRTEAAGWVNFTARTLASRGYDVRRIVRTGQAARSITARAAEESYDLVVTGVKGRTAAPFFDLGSVALAVLEHVPASVLLVREIEAGSRRQQVTREIRPLRVLIPVDGHAHSLAAIDRFLAWFREPHLEVHVVSAHDAAAEELLALLTGDEARVLRSKLEHAMRLRLHEAVNRLVPHGIAATSGVLEGRPADAVVAAAAAMNTDVIVLGSHGIRPAGERRLGSVALEIARTAPCTVLLVRET